MTTAAEPLGQAATRKSLEGRGQTEMRTRMVLLLCAVFALTVGVATATAGGGNSANAKLCQKNGWQTLYPSTGGTFTSEEACVSYLATGGTLESKSQHDCESFGGT